MLIPRKRKLESQVDSFKLSKLAEDIVDFKQEADLKIEKATEKVNDIAKESKEALTKVDKLSRKVETDIEEITDEVVSVLQEIKSNGLKGDKGDDPDEEAIANRVRDLFPTTESIIQEINPEKIAEKASLLIKPTPASLKIIKESVEMQNDEIVPKLNKATNLGDLKLSIANIKDWDGKWGEIKTEISRNKQYLHGGGDVVGAGAGITITTVNGVKVISATGGGTGTVTSVSVVSANGFSGSVANSTTTPAITLTTTVTGLIKGNGTAISAAVANTDYQVPITLTTTGSSGAATFDGTTLNIPQYSGTGTVTDVTSTDTSVTITSSTTTPDLSVVKITVADTTDSSCFVALFESATGVLAPKTDTGIAYNANTGVLSTNLAGNVTGNASTATALATSRTIGTITGDATSAGSSFDGTANNTNALTLATVNSNVGSFGSATQSVAITVNGKGLVTAISNVTITPAVGSITGLGTGVATALAVNVGSAGAFVTFNGALGTPSSGTVTNLTGTASININGTVGANTPTTATFTTATINTQVTLAENASVALDPSLSADGTWTGITMTGTAGYTQAFGDLVYLDPTDSRWEAADADVSTAADGDPRGILAMVVVAGTDGNACTLLLQGVIRADTAFPTMTVNAAMYVGETAGDIQATIPTGADNIVRVVGQALTADSLYFNPSSDWQITVA